MQNSQKKQDIELLKKFKEAVRIWRNTSSENYRSEINTMLPRIKQILSLTKSNRYVTLNAPLMMGGQRIPNNANALDLLFDCPFDMVVSQQVIDSCDLALGVLNDDEFSYPIKKKNEAVMRMFDEDDTTLFKSLIQQGESILNRYETENEEDLVNSKEFNEEYDQWRAEAFRLFETHFDLKNDIVFQEIGMNMLFIMKKRSAKYVEIILRAMKACYRMPYKAKAKKELNIKSQSAEGHQPININIHNENKNENKQSQEQSQELHLIVDLLKESLAPYQLEELKEVAKSDVPAPEKRKNLMDKILSFGESFGASVLANMLTNPQVIGML